MPTTTSMQVDGSSRMYILDKEDLIGLMRGRFCSGLFGGGFFGLPVCVCFFFATQIRLCFEHGHRLTNDSGFEVCVGLRVLNSCCDKRSNGVITYVLLRLLQNGQLRIYCSLPELVVISIETGPSSSCTGRTV